MLEVTQYLCTSDPRNPLFKDVYEFSDPDDIPEPRSEGCGCDNCFYGRDKLAIEIIRLRGKGA